MNASETRQHFARTYTDTLSRVLSMLPFADLGRVLEILERAYTQRLQVFIAGNGGSAATASHMANDLIKGIALPEGHGIRAISLSDNVPLMTAIGNDISYTEIFSYPLAQQANASDVLIVISASGNSPNILRAIETAKVKRMTTIGFLGMGGGKAAGMVDVPVVVPANDYGPVEDAHMIFDHLVMSYLKDFISNKQRSSL